MYNPEMAQKFDCYVQYDMPGVQFGADGPEYSEPPEFYKEGLREMGEAGYATAQSRFSLATLAESIGRVYEELLGESGG